MARPVLSLILALGMLLPGCMGGPTLVETSVPKESERVSSPGGVEERTIESAPRSRDDAFFVDTNVSPEGSVTAIEWTIPRGALIDFAPAFNGAESSDLKVVMIEAAFLYPDDKRELVTNWGVLVYRHEDDGSVAHLSPVVEPTRHRQAYDPVAGAIEDLPPSTNAFRFRIGPNTVSEGQNVTFVLLAQGAEAFPVRFAFKVVHSVSGESTFPTQDFVADFPADATGLAPRGMASGFRIAYFELAIGEDILGVTAPPAQTGSVEWTDGVVIGETFPASAPAFAVSRLLELSVGESAAGGTMHGGGLYKATSAAGQWGLHMDCYGTVYDASSGVAEAGDFMLIVQDNTIGTPWFDLDQAGEGRCLVRFTLDVAGVNGRERLYFRHVQYDASTENLFGRSLSEGAWAHLGRVGGVPLDPFFVTK